MAIEVMEDYRSLLVAVKHWIRAAQYEALKAVNRELMALYWDIGELIELLFDTVPNTPECDCLDILIHTQS